MPDAAGWLWGAVGLAGFALAVVVVVRLQNRPGSRLIAFVVWNILSTIGLFGLARLVGNWASAIGGLVVIASASAFGKMYEDWTEERGRKMGATQMGKTAVGMRGWTKWTLMVMGSVIAIIGAASVALR